MTDKKNFRDEFESETGFEWRPWRWASKGFGILVMLLVVGALISAVTWGIRVATSDAKGRGDAIVQKNSGTNRIEQQASFHQTFDSIKSLDQKLNDAQAQLNSFNKLHPNVGNGGVYDPMAEQQNNLMNNVIGIQQQCRNATADYNASTETYVARDFKDSDLPFKVDDPNDAVYISGQAIFTDHDCLPNAA